MTTAECAAVPDWRRIVWLASYPKSGNTWIRALLVEFLSPSRRAFPLNALPFGPAIDSSRFNELTGVAAEDCTQDEVESLIPTCLRVHVAESVACAEHRLCKDHGAYVANRMGEPLFPEDVTAGAVYIVRNPLDVAVSWAFHADEGDFSESVTRLNDRHTTLGGGGRVQYRKCLLDWSAHVRSWCAAPFPVLVVRYEDLLADTVRELRRVVRFLGFKGVAEERLRHAVAQSEFGSLRGREERGGFREKLQTNSGLFFRNGTVDSWRGALPAAEVRRVVYQHRSTMVAFGYDPGAALEAIGGETIPSASSTATMGTDRTDPY